MQSFMMGVIMGIPPPKDKALREHQKGQSELRGMSRKLAHVAGERVSCEGVYCHGEKRKTRGSFSLKDRMTKQ